MSTQANDKLQWLKRIKQQTYADIIEYKCIVKCLRKDLDAINSMHFSSTFFNRSIPNYKVKFESILRDKIWDLEQYLDERNKRFHDVEEKITEEEKKMSNVEDVVVDFYSGNAEYLKRNEYFSICHIELDHKKYAVVRGTNNLDGLDNWVLEEETLILENDPLLENYIIKDYGIFNEKSKSKNKNI